MKKIIMAILAVTMLFAGCGDSASNSISSDSGKSISGTKSVEAENLDKTVSGGKFVPSLKIPSNWDFDNISAQTHAGFNIYCGNEKIEITAISIDGSIGMGSADPEADGGDFTFDNGQQGAWWSDNKTNICFAFSPEDEHTVLFSVNYGNDAAWYKENQNLIREIAKTLSYGESLNTPSSNDATIFEFVDYHDSDRGIQYTIVAGCTETIETSGTSSRSFDWEDSKSESKIQYYISDFAEDGKSRALTVAFTATNAGKGEILVQNHSSTDAFCSAIDADRIVTICYYKAFNGYGLTMITSFPEDKMDDYAEAVSVFANSVSESELANNNDSPADITQIGLGFTLDTFCENYRKAEVQHGTSFVSISSADDFMLVEDTGARCIYESPTSYINGNEAISGRLRVTTDKHNIVIAITLINTGTPNVDALYNHKGTGIPDRDFETLYLAKLLLLYVVEPDFPTNITKDMAEELLYSLMPPVNLGEYVFGDYSAITNLAAPNDESYFLITKLSD